jgi:MFS family permease
MWIWLVCRQVFPPPTYQRLLKYGILIFCSLWLQGIAVVLPSLQAEFGISETHVRYTTCALFAGLCVGASCWGIGSDIMGRRLAFNFTLLIAGVFGIAAGAAPSWISACGLFAALGVGVGGNLPVDVGVWGEIPFPISNFRMIFSQNILYLAITDSPAQIRVHFFLNSFLPCLVDI